MNTIIESSEIEMAPSSKRSRALQVSMHEQDQYLCKILSIISGTTVAGMINSILEPYLQFVAEEVLKIDGYMDEYGRLLIDPEKLVQIYQKVNKGGTTTEYLNRINDYKNNSNLDFKFVSPSSLY